MAIQSEACNAFYFTMETNLAQFQLDSVTLKEKCENTELVLDKLKYYERRWLIYVDFKMVTYLLRQQGWIYKASMFSVPLKFQS